jgi:hypothetical protein
MVLTVWVLGASVLVGGVDITVQPRNGRNHSAIYQRVAALDRPSARTIDTLKRHDLERRYRRDVKGTLATLERIARADPDPETVFALAELSWVEGRRHDRWRHAAALDSYLDAVAFAHDFLFDPELATKLQPSDPRYRLALDIYNGGLEQLIRTVQSNGRIEPSGTIRLKVHGREQVLRVSLYDSPWKPEDVDQLLLSTDFEVSGLIAMSYQYGIGVPLIGVHETDRPPADPERFYPPEMAFPLTAFLQPNSRLRDANAHADGDTSRECTLVLLDPVRTTKLGQPPSAFTIETDLTTPLGYMWSRTDLSRFRWTGLLRPGEALARANLMLLRPYEKGKIPVVMVHGLISSPLAWIPMLNELLRDPTIQSRYQFLLYMYPTGVPIPIAAAGLRDALSQAGQMYNPDGSDPAFNQMVLLGHSMGGLLSHAMVVESGDRLWHLNSDRPFNQILGPPEDLAELQNYMFFQPLPFIRRVVFLATPHRGSDLSRGFVGRMGANLINEPDRINHLLTRLIKDNPDAFDRRKFRPLPTSIETLEPYSDILMALLEMPPGPNVAFHSVIGSLRPGGYATATDGVVNYRSAHIDGVESERVVRSDHGVQKAPEAILEVRRILLRHLNLTPSQPVVIAPSATAATAGSLRR